MTVNLDKGRCGGWKDECKTWHEAEEERGEEQLFEKPQLTFHWPLIITKETRKYVLLSGHIVGLSKILFLLVRKKGRTSSEQTTADFTLQDSAFSMEKEKVRNSPRCRAFVLTFLRSYRPQWSGQLPTMFKCEPRPDMQKLGPNENSGQESSSVINNSYSQKAEGFEGALIPAVMALYSKKEMVSYPLGQLRMLECVCSAHGLRRASGQ
ncbi:uncharacterized protein LOC112470133 [Pteropus alecto]|uniref:uncharacterized protein LOC112470133 n=1 Tax=Pteropus alecto TaxID=9402 RepID=UPI000D539009|nr:uncharacterized protein LOC112470133 [Pteropus alecto]